MALSSASKKKPSAAAKRKVAAKRKTSAKPKAVVKKTLSLSNRKQKKPPPAPVALPSDWPVASQPPLFPPDASALRPGSLLRQTCSGNDIQLARSACVVPNFEKQKGKFLLIFPGNFSFGATQSEATETDPDKKTESAKTTTKKPATFMGRIEGLRTKNPSFRIPFPHLQKSLVFPGKKVATTSKFLALSCSNKKKGAVQCKNIFSSAVVFGMPKWESSKENGTVISTPINTTTSSIVSPLVAKSQSQDLKQETVEVNEDSDTKPEHPFLHYGGSERTVDGATRSSRKSLSNNKNPSDDGKSTFIEEKVPIWSNHTNHSDKPPSTFDFSNNSHPPVKAAQPKQGKSFDSSSDDFVELSSDSDGDYGGSKNDPNLSATKTRLPPRRQASMTKKKYVEEEEQESSDDNDDNDDSESDVEESPKTKKASVKKKAETASKKQPQKRKSTTTKSNNNTKKEPSTKKEVIKVDSDDDSSSYASETLNDTEQIQKRSAPRRKSRGQKQANYKEESDMEEEDDEDSEKENASNESDDSPKSKKPKANKGTKSTPSKSIRKTPSSKRKAAPSKSSSATTTPKAAKRARANTASSEKKKQMSSEKKKTAGIEKKKSISERVSTPSPGAKSPFRRRHKKKSPGKSRTQQVLDLTQDDEFTFG